MKIVVVNAFSLNMLNDDVANQNYNWHINHFAKDQVIETLNRATSVASFIGHKDIANIVGSDLGQTFEFNRSSYTYNKGDTLLVAQYRGERLAEGTTVLPEGSTIEYYLVYALSRAEDQD
jgi:hypothetical protein